MHNELTYILIITILMEDYQRLPVILEVGEEAAIGHEGHDDVRGRSTIKTYTPQGENIGVIKL